MSIDAAPFAGPGAAARPAKRGVWYAVVLHFGSVETTTACVASLDALGFDRVVLVDNGSGAPKLADLAAGRPWLRLARNADNVGYAAGNNLGLRLARDEGAQFVAVFNNDVVVEYPRMLGDAEDLFDSCELLGVAWPHVFFLSDGWKEQPADSRFRRMLLGAAARERGDGVPALPPSVRRTDAFAGCSWMAPMRVLAKVGLLREDLFLYHEEVDFAIRLRRVGLYCGQVGVGKGRVLHYGSTARGLSPSQAYYCGRNAVLLLENFPASRRTKLVAGTAAYVAWMALRCLAAGRVSSAVGCWEGYLAGLGGRRGKR